MAPAPRIRQGVRRERAVVGGVAGDWLYPRVDPTSKAVIMFVHGGSMYFGLSSAHVEVAAQLAALTGLPTFAIDHRLMPEHAYPAAHDDTAAAYAALSSAGPVVLIGESSGGVLSLAAMRRASAAGIEMPLLWIGISPTIDYDLDADPDFRRSGDPFNAPEFSAVMVRGYVGGADLASSDLSPVAAGLAGMPSLIVHYADKDLIRSHSRRLAARAAADEVACTSREWPGMWHGWHLFAIPEAREVIGAMADEIRHHLQLTQSPKSPSNRPA